MRGRVDLLLIAALAAACGGPAPSAAAPPAACAALQIPAPTSTTPARSDTPTPGYALASGSKPVGIAYSSGYVWVAESGSDRLAALRVGDGTLREYRLPVSQLGFNLAVAPDGRVWTAEQYRDAVAGVSLDGSVRECRLAHGSGPVGMAVAADGTLWVAESDAGAVARLRPGGLAFETFSLPGRRHQLSEILVVADGVYVSEIGGDSVAHVSSSGQVTEIGLGVSAPKAIGMLATADGSLWVAEFGADRVARIASGQVTQVPFPAGSKPQSLAPAAGGRILVTSSGADRIDSIDTASNRVTPGPRTGGWPDHLVLAPDGATWFTEYTGERLARLPDQTG